MAEVDLKAKLTEFPVVESVSITDEGAVKLKWSKVPLAEKYDIKRSDSPSGEYVHVDWAEGTEYTDNTVEKNITYWYKVVAWKHLEGKKTSQKASAVTPACVTDIASVEGLTSYVKDGKIHLKWNRGDGDVFFVYKKLHNVTRLFFAGRTDTCEFCDENTVSGQIYYYTVQTVKIKDGNELHGKFSEKTSAVFVDATEITSARTAPGKRSCIDVRVVAGADGYILERSDKKDGDFQEIARSEDIVAVNFDDRLPTRFKSYYYRACAYKKSGDKVIKGAYSPIKSVSAK